MAYVLQKIVELHFYFNDKCSDPRIKDWFLMKDPFQGLCILAGYLYFVFKIGPRLMENRRPFNLDLIMKAYNLAQVIFCGWLFLEGLKIYINGGYNLLCQGIDRSKSDFAMFTANRVYLYFIVKVIDLLDTIFFVLRKKQSQVTFLHVYHHTGMVILSWGGCKYLPGGHAVFLGTINCFVHTIMYFYYFLTAISDSYKKSIWWKRHITQLQMIQFGLLALHYFVLLFKSWLVPDCTFPLWPMYIILPQNLFIFLLFADFYRKNYLLKAKVN